MKNCIVAKIEFDFKGQHHAPSIEFDLDDWAEKSDGEIHNLVGHIAKMNGIGAYSYELEVMEMETVLFSSPQGFAVDFYDQSTQQFDFEAFYQKWHAERLFNQLDKICQATLKHPLEKDSDLFNALSQAYAAGHSVKKVP